MGSLREQCPHLRYMQTLELGASFQLAIVKLLCLVLNRGHKNHTFHQLDLSSVEHQPDIIMYVRRKRLRQLAQSFSKPVAIDTMLQVVLLDYVVFLQGKLTRRRVVLGLLYGKHAPLS
jgi:hypothetical protein